MSRTKNTRIADGPTLTFRPWTLVKEVLDEKAPSGGKINRSFVINDLILKGAEKEKTKKGK